MIKYFCDHCGKEIRKLDNLREIEYGWSAKGCIKNNTAVVMHKKCMWGLNKSIQDYLPTAKIHADTIK